MPGQAPRFSSRLRLAVDRALTRGSKGAAGSNGPGCAGAPSSSRMSSPLSLSASASALPTMPAPTMMMSACMSVPRANSDDAGAQAHGLAGEPVLGGRQQIQAEQSQVPGLVEQRQPGAEQPGQAIGEADGEVLIQLLARLIARQGRQAAQRLPAFQQGLGQGQGVAQAQVETLAGDRMQAVHGIAQHHQMRAHLFAGLDQRQRIQVTSAHLAEGTQPEAEGLLQLVQEGPLGGHLQAFGILRITGPDQYAAIVQ